MTSAHLVTAVDQAKTSSSTACAYRTGRRDGEQAAAAACALYRREVAIVLDGLGDALIAKDEALIEVWYSLASRLAAGGPLMD